MSRLGARLRRVARWRAGWARMSWEERRCLLAALVLNPSIRWLLRHRGTAAAARFVHRWSDSSFRRRSVTVDERVIRRAKRAGAAVNRAALEPAPAVTCLARSFAAQLLLRRVGIPAELRIGVRPAPAAEVAAGASGEPASLLFHAWVEVDGTPVNDALDVADQHAVFPLEGLESLAAFSSRARR